MKINGHVLDKPREVSLYLPINDTEVVCLRFLPVEIDFEEILAKPLPPNKIVPGGQRLQEFDDPNYKLAVSAWAGKRLHYQVLKSLSGTEGLEWAKVKMDDPETWHLWEDELSSVFGVGVKDRIYGKYAEANLLSEAVLEEARERFLASQAAATLNG